MNKIFTIFILLLSLSKTAKGDHITGGQIYYTCSPGATGYFNYFVTFKLYMRCFSTRQFNNPTIVSVFDKVTNQRISDVNVSLRSTETISISDADPCITNPPQVCYVVGYYDFTLSLPASANGYILSSQVNYRIAGINNLQSGYSNIGATYTAEIPGLKDVPNGPNNNSAKFTGSDLVVVCAENRFSYSFAATDNDGDELRYSFCSAYRSGGGGNMIVPPPNPPYVDIPYGNGFGSGNPLGANVQINPATGLITGTAPAAGIYVVTVCVDEIRNGKIIARQRKDLQINIAACNIAAAQLAPDYMLCSDSKTLNPVNLSSSPLIHTQYWTLTSRSGSPLFTSNEMYPSYTFTDTGSYFVRLIINRGEACTDSTSSIVRVYPGFVPNFIYKGICLSRPTTFTDATTTVYGQVNSWNWNLGDNEFSTEQNLVHTYSSTGIKNVQLIAENTVGCRDTVSQVIDIVTAPPIRLAFKDTLICISDEVTLNAAGEGIFTWTPTANTLNANTPTPTVKPTETTRYNVHLNDDGCINDDTVLVRVTDHVSLQTMADTTICLGDTIRIRVVSDAFSYSWTPANQLIDASAASPLAVTNASSMYSVTARIGSCVTSKQVFVSAVPYPTAYAGKDTMICFNSRAMLTGITDGRSVSWSPSLYLNDYTILNPIATPRTTMQYVFSAYDTRGCPKKGSDTVTVAVLPDILASAGNDTSVIVDQPLQLKATGGSAYLWHPDVGLSASDIPDPVARFNEPTDGVLYKVLVYNEAGCIDSASLTIKVFNTGPSIFVPTAFTPNGDGRNDVIRPIAVGIKQIETFSIYNRWGQMIFKGNANGKGWDGSIGGIPQPTGVYVWFVKATDYNGTPYFKKGTVTLIK